MKHGPIALIDEDMPVVFIATKNSSYEKVISNIQEVKARKGNVIAIVTEGDTEVKKMADYVLKYPKQVKHLCRCWLPFHYNCCPTILPL